MAETDTAHRTDPDAELFGMIRRRAAAWRESGKADVAHDGKRRDERADVAGELELRIAFAEVETHKGFLAKCRTVSRDDFDFGGWQVADIIAVAVQIGREAERLGITKIPALLPPEERIAAG